MMKRVLNNFIFVIFMVLLMIISISACSTIYYEAYIPTIEEFETSYPYEFDFTLAKEKGLTDSADEVSEMYIKASSLYRKALETYLLDKYDLAKYDRELADNELDFLPVKNEDKNLYHRWSTLECEYIYLRNNVHVERLSQEDIDLLIQRINKEKYTVDNQLLDMVERTYKEVIAIRFNPSDTSEFKTMYTFGSGVSKMALNTAVVFEITYTKVVDENNNYVDIEKTHNQLIYLDDFTVQMSEKLTKEIGKPVSVFVEN